MNESESTKLLGLAITMGVLLLVALLIAIAMVVNANENWKETRRGVAEYLFWSWGQPKGDLWLNIPFNVVTLLFNVAFFGLTAIAVLYLVGITVFMLGGALYGVIV